MRTLTPLALAAVLSAVPIPPAAADDPISDAEALALELSGELLAPPVLTATIDAHLQSIRAVEPVLGAVRCYPPWEPGTVFVRLTSAAWDEYESGSYVGLDSLDALYGPVEIVAEYDFMKSIVMDFTAHYQPVLLGAIYENAPGVANVNPAYYGFADTDITAAAPGDYTFRYGWLSCPLGCVYNHYWNYAIDGTGAPALVAEWGDPLQGVGAPEALSAPGIALRVQPNPFTGATEIRASVPIGRPTTMEIVDPAGRHVRRLAGGTGSREARVAHWDGRDDAGRPAGAGVYFVVLRSEGGVHGAQRVVLLR